MNEFFRSEDGRKLYKTLLGLIGIITIFFVFEIISLARAWSVSEPAANTITVSGTGTATSTPDIATFSFSVSADASAVADAESTVSGKTSGILSALKDLGIADKDIQTTDYNVYPKYKYVSAACPMNAPCPPSNQVPDGYTVSESVSVKVRDTSKAGDALTLVGQKGATNVSGLSLTLDDPNAPAETARLNAIDDAKARASALAKRLDVHLGKVVSFDDGNTSSPGPIYPMAYDAKAAGSAVSSVPVAIGENKVTATVNVTYEIR